MPKRSPSLSLPLLDPLKRFGVRRRYAKPSAMPQIRVLGGDPIVPLFRQPEPPAPPPPSPDDPLDAANIHRRLDAIGRALDDLPKQAQRMARWHARRDARWARERGDAEHADQSLWKMPPHRLALRARHLSPTSWGRGIPKLERGRGNPKLERRHRHRDSSPPRSGGEVARAKRPRRRGGKLGRAGRDAGSACAMSPGKGPPRAIKHHRRSRQNPAASTASPRCGRAVRRVGAKGRTTMSTRC